MFKWLSKPYMMWTVIDDIACTVSILLCIFLVVIVVTIVEDICDK